MQVILQRPLLQSQLKDIQLLHGKSSHAPHALLPFPSALAFLDAGILPKACVVYAELGCRLVVVLGGKIQIDNYLNMRGLEPKIVGGYRITDDDAMLAAMEAAGTSRMLVEAQLSKVSPVVLLWLLCIVCFAC